MRLSPKINFIAPLLALALAACEVLSPPGATPAPTASVIGSQAAALATPTYPVTPPATATFAPTTAPLSSLGLNGRLIYSQGLDGLWQIDMASGEQTSLWAIPDNGYLAGVAASPDGTRLAVTYSPPPPEGTPQLGSTSLYLTDGDGANPELVLEPVVQFELFLSPAWSPDGAWIYYTHYQPVYDNQGTFSGLILNIERMPAEGGPSEVVIEGAQQGALSADGTKIVYLHFNLETYATGLWIANADGTEAKELVPDTAFFALSAPRLSPDGTRIAFGASGPLQTSLAPRASDKPGALARVAGFFRQSRARDQFERRVAAAHGPPWEVWEVSPEGGEPTQITQLYTDGPWPAWSPDGAHLVALQPGGVLLLGEGDPIFLGPAQGHGEIVWIP